MINSRGVARLNLLLIGGWLAMIGFFLALFSQVSHATVPQETRDEIFFRFVVLCFAMLLSTYSRVTEVSPINRHLVRNMDKDGNALMILASTRSTR
jgi:peptidoglycan/LPS O-acetylase OafA/YrhL